MTTAELQSGVDNLLEKISTGSGLSSLVATRSSSGSIEFQANNSGEWKPSLEEALYALTPDGIKASKLKKAQEFETKAAKLRMEVNG